MVYDFGRNFAGVVLLNVTGRKGAKVVLRYGELLWPNGTVNVMTSVAGQLKYKSSVQCPLCPALVDQKDVYICRGDAQPETWVQRFVWHGFRYAEVTVDAGVAINSLSGLALASDVERTSNFSTSQAILNDIYKLVVNTQRSNMMSVQSDCPHREKLGYGGDAIASAETFISVFDMSTFYEKRVRDFNDAVRENGGFTETAPFVGLFMDGLGDMAGSVDWGSAEPLIQWWLYKYYGNKRLLEESWPLIDRYMQLLAVKSSHGGLLGYAMSDWMSTEPTSGDMSGTGFYFWVAQTAAKIANVLGNQEDALRYAKVAADVADVFNGHFLNASTGVYSYNDTQPEPGDLRTNRLVQWDGMRRAAEQRLGVSGTRLINGTQCGQSMPLALGITPPELRSKVAEALVENVRRNQMHHMGGMFSVKWTLDALSTYGFFNEALSTQLQRTYPSFGFMMDNNATTVWESWFFSNNTFSHNHPMFGAVVEWFHKHVAGLQMTDDAVAFDRAIIRPRPSELVRELDYDYSSARGRYHISWVLRNASLPAALRLRLVVPPNCNAELHLPTYLWPSQWPDSIQILERAQDTCRGTALAILAMIVLIVPCDPNRCTDLSAI
jgi:alpha-L-rhamnosidase